MVQANSREGQIGWSKWMQLVFALLIAFYTAASLYTTLEGNWSRLGLAPLPVSDLHLRAEPAPNLPQYWRRVTSVEPETAARYGVQVGDTLRFDNPLFYKHAQFVGDSFGITVEHDGVRRHLNVVLKAAEGGGHAPGDIAVNVVWLIYTLTMTGLALLVLWKRWGNPAAMCLGLILLTLGLTNDTIPNWSPSNGFDFAYYLFTSAGTVAIGLLPALFYFLCENARQRWQRRLVAGWFILFALVQEHGMYRIASQLGRESFLPPPSAIMAASWVIGLLIACVILVANFPKLDAVQRNRVKLIAAAFLLFVSGQVIGTAQFLRAIPLGTGYAATWVEVILSLTAAALLAYSMIRHRLFDFGFAVNRTLVFGSLSFILLATFGLLEWGAEHFVPEAWHEGGPFISAAVALGLFLSFHRLRDWIERHVERLFFGSWQRAEAALRRFVESAGHFDKMPKLCATFADAASRYAGGPAAALYLRKGQAYRLEAGQLAGAEANYADDDPAFALMRTERRPIELAQAKGALPGALALPMLDQGALAGFVLLDSKRDGAQYRPDEIENLGWAAHQVGLDLQALHARELEAEVSLLRHDKQELLAIIRGREQAQG